ASGMARSWSANRSSGWCDRTRSSPTNTTGSGCRWIRTRTGSNWRTSTPAAMPPGRCGTVTDPARRSRTPAQSPDRPSPDMYALDLSTKARAPLHILCLGAPSDDIEIGCGGLVLDLIRRRRAVDVDWVVFSAKEERHQEATQSADLFLRGARRKRVIVEQF